MINSKIPILSCFSGGGFLDMGFEIAGFSIVWTNEIEPSFSTFYSEGITSWKKNKEAINNEIKCTISNNYSIKDVTQETVIDEAFGGEKPDVFGMIGGPPCQDFSINGNLNGFKGDRGSLTDTYLYKVLELQPSFFVMENVTGLIKVKKHGKHFFELLKAMADDYLIDWDVLNSLEFGVPQSRERIFVIGLNKKQFQLDSIKLNIKGQWFPFRENAIYQNPQTYYKWPQPNAFGNSVSKSNDIPLQLCLDSCLVPYNEEQNIPNADEYFNLTGDKERFKQIKEGETNRPSFKRLHRFKYSPTACYGNNEVHLHPYYNRRLSVREALRIQGVDDSYVLSTKGQLSKKFKMIGNGVPVPLAAAVAKTLRDFINKLKLITG
ncbi:DNA cytosine methyltransferase [Daejeonella sp.]|uniref:DNA cytosine methyltransferase n=1 Tax=Daejeonella sp. TaxID=2805397 RepID=UPI00272F853F|nr:DNA cytosine methyltransferase [Daejeonella sp.]MDP2413380.1 DNA cytosine methyltransferase [Daejeonella sp.]